MKDTSTFIIILLLNIMKMFLVTINNEFHIFFSVFKNKMLNVKIDVNRRKRLKM